MAVMKPFEIFRAGRHTSSQGTTLSFGEDELSAVVASYDPALHEAPIVVGHPRQDAPAYGWIESLTLKDGRLIAVPRDVNPEFAELVKAGSYRKRSAAFYRPDSPNNPTPGRYHLRHVGFLGAEPPAVKGLKAVEFSDADDGFVEFSDADAAWNSAWALSNVARLFRALREHFIATENIETADRLVPEWDIGQLEQAAADTRAEARAIERPAFSETTTEDTTMTKTAEERLAEIEAREAALAERENRVKADEATFAEATRKAQAEADAAFVAEQVAAGRLPVGLQASATALFTAVDFGELTFAEGDEEVKTTPRAAFRDLLSKLPKPVSTGEIATGDGPDFSDPAHVQAAIETEIRKAGEKGETLSPAEAAMRLKING